MSKNLYQFQWDNDYAFIGGLFVATPEEIEDLIGKHLYLGDMEGKYSEVEGTVEESDITLISTNPVVVETIGDFGINPLNYIS